LSVPDLAEVIARVRYGISAWEDAVRSFGELSAPTIAPQDALALCAAAEECSWLREELAQLPKPPLGLHDRTRVEFALELIQKLHENYSAACRDASNAARERDEARAELAALREPKP
jgi:hypothetical protein